MTDLLAERFALLADTTDDSDWLDVRRRARRARRFALPVAALVAAALVGATALAAGGGWLFKGRGGEVTATRTLFFRGTTYRLTVNKLAGDLVCTHLDDSQGRRLATGCGVPVLGEKPAYHRPHVPPIPLSFATSNFGVAVPGGEIWFGAARSNVARVTLRNAAGRMLATGTTAAPPSLKTKLRFWSIATRVHGLDLTAYNFAGNPVGAGPLLIAPVPAHHS
jgi:hypothetical protein